MNNIKAFPNRYYPNTHIYFLLMRTHNSENQIVIDRLIKIISKGGNELILVKWIECILTPNYSEPSTWEYKIRNIKKSEYTIEEFFDTRERYHRQGEFGDNNAHYLIANCENSCNILVEEWDQEFAIISANDDFTEKLKSFANDNAEILISDFGKYINECIYLNPICKDSYIELVKNNFNNELFFPQKSY